jgi:hypothetical protein
MTGYLVLELRGEGSAADAGQVGLGHTQHLRRISILPPPPPPPPPQRTLSMVLGGMPRPVNAPPMVVLLEVTYGYDPKSRSSRHALAPSTSSDLPCAGLRVSLSSAGQRHVTAGAHILSGGVQVGDGVGDERAHAVRQGAQAAQLVGDVVVDAVLVPQRRVQLRPGDKAGARQRARERGRTPVTLASNESHSSMSPMRTPLRVALELTIDT